MRSGGGKEVVAVLASDLHFSHKPPLARSVEPDWYAAMLRPIEKVKSLLEEHECPLVVAGDLLDKPAQPPELVNWLIDNLPICYAIPGQHDLPLHSYADIKKSSYWTLVRAGVIKNLTEPFEVPYAKVPIRLHAFPWGQPPKGPDEPLDMYLEVGVIHSYVWAEGHSYPGAPEEKLYSKYLKDLCGFDVCLFGDNHIHFSKKKPKSPLIYNSGTFMRRKQDERELEPSVGLLHPDGSVTRYKMDCSQDKYLEPEEVIETLTGLGFETFVEELSALGESAVNFSDALTRLLDRQKVNPKVKNLILKAMEVE